ncbi:HNH endonuclease [Bradyrhizobium betae]|uniref:HNH endonuclease n=1 Tax=Bradyrhizobium betae TaxID=244734 RepID=A0A5P6PFE2_9BRAD|nr:HNH endonuclease signature motif containing protein [Bradyrhizobium betae]MCS3725915.1 5-methylcytosine-specific restriction endonuclease McrA [Bradyrhizobium betae]QFI76960.1 HNH endonuclease [Bradyrhizobium betae]
MRWIGFLLVLLVSPAAAEEYITHPQWHLTPGVTQDLTARQICRVKWGQDARSVTAKMKQNVIDAYRFDVKRCPLTTFQGKRVRRLEIDHLIPRSIGGADDEHNLWPQCYEQVKPDKSQQEDGAHKKDRLETYLHAQLCKSPSDDLLREYQSKIRSNWISFYHEVYADELMPVATIFEPFKREVGVSGHSGTKKKVKAIKKRRHVFIRAKHPKKRKSTN